MNTTLRLKNTRCLRILPPDDGSPVFAMVDVDDGAGELNVIVHPGQGVIKARELAAMLNAAADAVEEELDRRWDEAVDAAEPGPVDPVAESLDREVSGVVR